MVQYYAALVITGAFKGTSRDRIYRELGLESLDLRTLDNSLQERKYLRHPFFLIVLKEWNNLSEELRKIKSTVQFKTKILSFIRPKENSIFKIHDITVSSY